VKGIIYESPDSLGIDWEPQLLVYAVNVNLLGHSVNAIKELRNTLRG
jgi:hypothetical protein